MAFVKELLQFTNNKYFVETGTYVGETVDFISNNSSAKIYSIELSTILYDYCKNKFINNNNIKIILEIAN